MIMNKGRGLIILYVTSFLGSFCAGLGNGHQISPVELLAPDIYAICEYETCVFPRYGVGLCLDGRLFPNSNNSDYPEQTLLMRGKLIAKTTLSAVFLMYKRYSVPIYFFETPYDWCRECSKSGGSLQEMLNADPDLKGIQKGDNLCILPLELFGKGKSTKKVVRAFESVDAFPSNLLDCDSFAYGGIVPLDRKKWF